MSDDIHRLALLLQTGLPRPRPLGQLTINLIGASDAGWQFIPPENWYFVAGRGRYDVYDITDDDTLAGLLDRAVRDDRRDLIDELEREIEHRCQWDASHADEKETPVADADTKQGQLVAELERETEYRVKWDDINRGKTPAADADDPILMVPLPTSMVQVAGDEWDVDLKPNLGILRLVIGAACREVLPKRVAIEVLVSTRDLLAGVPTPDGDSWQDDCIRASQRSLAAESAEPICRHRVPMTDRCPSCDEQGGLRQQVSQ